MPDDFACLLDHAGSAIGANINDFGAIEGWGRLGQELAELLMRRNGFYAFDSALLVRPWRNEGRPRGAVEWNQRGLWKSAYDLDLGAMWFFAEDVFGGQFCFYKDAICTFDPETAQFETMATTFADWVSEIVSDPEFRTGHPLAHAWQKTNPSIRFGERLLPKVPFACGGEFTVENLYAGDEVEGMLFRASFANQIRRLPDGTRIVLRIDGERE